MRTFDELMELAAGFKGDIATVEELLPSVETAETIKKVGDDRILSLMARGVFQAGFSWKVIDKKWPGFEEAFEGFVP
ncbi:MAG: 3-methyladenine DNA glycosylase, partial [Kordiimonas sp.]